MTKRNTPHLALHTLLVALSYWGTAVRMLLVTFLLSVAYAVGVSNGVGIGTLIVQFVSVVGWLFLLDAGYVTIAKALPFRHETVDQVLFCLVMAGLFALVFLPHFVVVSSSATPTSLWLFLVTLFLLGGRLLLAMIYGRRDT